MSDDVSDDVSDDELVSDGPKPASPTAKPAGPRKKAARTHPADDSSADDSSADDSSDDDSSDDDIRVPSLLVAKDIPICNRFDAGAGRRWRMPNARGARFA